jgi:hypothetical protein
MPTQSSRARNLSQDANSPRPDSSSVLAAGLAVLQLRHSMKFSGARAAAEGKREPKVQFRFRANLSQMKEHVTSPLPLCASGDDWFRAMATEKSERQDAGDQMST